MLNLQNSGRKNSELPAKGTTTVYILQQNTKNKIKDVPKFQIRLNVFLIIVPPMKHYPFLYQREEFQNTAVRFKTIVSKWQHTLRIFLPYRCAMSWSCAISTRSTNLIFPGISFIKLAEYLIRGLPLARFPSILPSSASFSKPFLLSKCQRNRSCRVLTTLNNSLLTPASSNTLSFVILAVRKI